MTHDERTVSSLQSAPRLVLFDLDDTLCDYASARALRLRIAFTQAFPAGSTPDDHHLDRMIAESIAIHPHGTEHFADLLARHGVSEAAPVHAARHWYQSHRFHGLRLFADAAETLAIARGGDAPRHVGVITNGPAEVQRAKLQLLELEREVDFTLVSGEFGVAKPDPSIFAEALRLTGAPATETVFIGDSLEFDVAGASGMGMQSVWVNRTGRPHPGGHPRPDHEIRELRELWPLLAD